MLCMSFLFLCQECSEKSYPVRVHSAVWTRQEKKNGPTSETTAAQFFRGVLDDEMGEQYHDFESHFNTIWSQILRF